MESASLIPTPDAIPVHWPWFQLLLLVTFFLHILLMNVMLGTVLIAFIRHLHRPGQSNVLTKEISAKLPFTVALAVNFGVAPLLFVQVLYGHFIYTSTILMAWPWIAIIDILILAYYTAYIYRYRYPSLGEGRVVATGLIAICLLIIGFLFVNNFTLMLDPPAWTRAVTRPTGLLLHFSDPSLIPRYLHFVLSALAVGGLAIALYFSREKDDQAASAWVAYGCRWFGYATFANFGVGFLFLDTLPREMLHPTSLVGGLLVIFLIIGMACGIIAAIYGLRLQVWPALYLLLGSIFAMILVRELLRVAMLKPWFTLADLHLAPAYTPLLLFLLFFGGGIVLIGWMLKITYQTFQNEEVRS